MQVEFHRKFMKRYARIPAFIILKSLNLGPTRLTNYGYISVLSFPRRRESRAILCNLDSPFQGNDTKRVSPKTKKYGHSITRLNNRYIFMDLLVHKSASLYNRNVCCGTLVVGLDYNPAFYKHESFKYFMDYTRWSTYNSASI